MSDARPFSHIAFCGTVMDCLPDAEFRSLASQLSAATHTGPEPSLIVALASELLGRDPLALPNWVDTDTRYLVVLDVPEQAILRLASTLRLHKPDQRLHVCRDPSVVKRLVIALKRPAPWEGILDAYVLEDSLVVALGDMSARQFPIGRLPKVKRFEPAVVKRFEIDSAGSYLHWPDGDVHMGPSQMLQAVDPMYLSDVEIRRYQMENVSQALFDMRNDRRLKQTEIPGLSERHVRRLEKEEVRLTVDAANKFADAFQLSPSEFLDELSERVTGNTVASGENPGHLSSQVGPLNLPDVPQLHRMLGSQAVASLDDAPTAKQLLMDPDRQEALRRLNADYNAVRGSTPDKFFCPILHRDEDVELCKAHIINASFPNSDRTWTIQRADVDNWFGAMFEADFLKLKHKDNLKALDVLADRELTRQLRPKVTLDGEEVGHYALSGRVPAEFSPVLIDHESEQIKLVFKLSPKKLLEAEDKKWDIGFEQDLRLPALVALLKAAHLTLFHLVGYRYALSAGGRFLGRNVLGEFFDQLIGRPKSDVLLQAPNHFGEFQNLVRPVLSPATGFAGTITDGLFYLCMDSEGPWAVAVMVRTGEHMHTVLVPIFDQAESAARFLRFLAEPSARFEATLARYSGENWEVSPAARQFEWPEANFDL